MHHNRFDIEKMSNMFIYWQITQSLNPLLSKEDAREYKIKFLPLKNLDHHTKISSTPFWPIFPTKYTPKGVEIFKT
jgi:hypothetical protein